MMYFAHTKIIIFSDLVQNLIRGPSVDSDYKVVSDWPTKDTKDALGQVSYPFLNYLVSQKKVLTSI